MRRSIVITALWCAALLCGTSQAQEQTLYGGCVDAAGHPVEAIPDASLPLAITTRVENGNTVIRYNHAMMPRLDDKARLFLYAHECSRLNLGESPVARSQAGARKADCWASATLLRTGLITIDDLEPLQNALAFSADEWRLLPGPIRRIDLRSCPRHLSPSIHAPRPDQDDWNTCTRRCADASLACLHSAGSSACDVSYGRCTAQCDASFPR
ncbi:hypothetical protein J5J83_02745 [Azoarcus sp. L1K30]|uniref:hypothetical protein n=1 Tax=Azoarcus sp. L1K30 TaxID=2820277 RepID=UPI001B823E77|nr:hypothetical protein [Azoarcus sp. L1K30]MBR0565034.1 hypothetical protein [Azoarcus sp. L1K30]